MTPESNGSLNAATIEERRFLWSASRVAAQLCGKHISAAVNQQATIKEAVFSVGTAPMLYEGLTQVELELSRVSELAVVAEDCESRQTENNSKKGVRLCKEDFVCDLKLQ
jgi:hypothetical protein